jgi:hypothetical protein
MSLDDIYESMSWPIGELDPFSLSVRMQVTRVVFAIGVKALLDDARGRRAAQQQVRDLGRHSRSCDSCSQFGLFPSTNAQ